jgi:hypothetical protein
MKYLRIVFLILTLLSPASFVFGQADFAITAPGAGSAVMGKVEVRGYIKATDFSNFDLEFSHATADDTSWFPITTSTENPADGLLGIWDTTSIADGDYRLRLTVVYKDNSRAEVTVQGLRVRNYTPIETSTPDGEVTTSGQTASIVKPTFPAPPPQQNGDPTNDLEIGQDDLLKTDLVSLAVGIILAVLLAYLFKEKNS